jgi:hypothetical protein
MNISAIGTTSTTLSYTFQYRRRSRGMSGKKESKKDGVLLWPVHDGGDPKEAAGRTSVVKAVRNASIAPFAMKRARIDSSVSPSGCLLQCVGTKLIREPERPIAAGHSVPCLGILQHLMPLAAEGTAHPMHLT